ncbi:hypothetical protein I3843_14G026900 [Carya illinoinensis]|nr:hypothetical protein I3843_14G026900 [Carya illinoinensis]
MADPPPPIRISYIPDDMVLEILARLPLKSLLSFRRVCKSWNSIISSRYFFATHLKYGPRRGYYLLYQTMLAQIHEPSCTVVCDRTYDRISKLKLPFMHARIVGSCNGLLCVESLGDRGRLSLWNPSIARFKVLPAPCLLARGYSVTYGFTYVSEENDFKIVRISYSEFSTTLPQAQVYTLSSNSWRSIDDPIPLKPDVQIYNIGCNHLPCPFIAGALHWIVRSKGSCEDYGSGNKKILSFDLRDEKFGKMALPSSYLYYHDGWEYLGLFKGKLALFSFSNSRCGIWVMTDYGMAESWTLLRNVEFEPGVIDFRGCTDGGAVVIARMRREFSSISFIETHEEAPHRERILDGGHLLIFAAPFVESLALLDASHDKVNVDHQSLRHQMTKEAVIPNQ